MTYDDLSDAVWFVSTHTSNSSWSALSVLTVLALDAASDDLSDAVRFVSLGSFALFSALFAVFFFPRFAFIGVLVILPEAWR